MHTTSYAAYENEKRGALHIMFTYTLRPSQSDVPKVIDFIKINDREINGQ